MDSAAVSHDALMRDHIVIVPQSRGKQSLLASLAASCRLNTSVEVRSRGRNKVGNEWD